MYCFLNPSMKREPGVSFLRREVLLQVLSGQVHPLPLLFFNRLCGATVVLVRFRKLIQWYRHILVRELTFSPSIISQIPDPSISPYFTVHAPAALILSNLLLLPSSTWVLDHRGQHPISSVRRCFHPAGQHSTLRCTHGHQSPPSSARLPLAS